MIIIYTYIMHEAAAATLPCLLYRLIFCWPEENHIVGKTLIFQILFVKNLGTNTRNTSIQEIPVWSSQWGYNLYMCKWGNLTQYSCNFNILFYYISTQHAIYIRVVILVLCSSNLKTYDAFVTPFYFNLII